MQESADDIIIDWVDENDEVINPIKRKNIYRENASFRTAHIFIFDKKGRLLMQQLASTRDRYPGRWGSSVAGYLLSGETYEQAALRKVTDELGINADNLELKSLGKTFIEDEGRRKFITLYTAEYDGELKPNAEQIDDTKYYSINELQKMKEENEETFTPTFLHLLDYYKSQTK